MVLQMQPAKAQLWGWGVPGTKLVLALGPGGASGATVDANGRWAIEIPPQKAGPAFGTGNLILTTLGSTATHKTILSDVQFGEVW
jgi:hypothetical protein